MRPALITPLTNILLFGWAGVDWDSLVRVASTAEETRSGVDELVKVFYPIQKLVGEKDVRTNSQFLSSPTFVIDFKTLER